MLPLVPLETLNRTDYSLYDIVPLTQLWRSGAHYTGYLRKGRPYHGLILYTGCYARYSDSLSAAPGDVFYLPQDALYDMRCEQLVGSDGVADLLINFRMTDAHGAPFRLATEPTKLVLRNAPLVRHYFKDIFEVSQNALHPPALIKAALYELLTELAEAAVPSSPIEPAVRYIAANCLKESIRVSFLAALCHMSEANFRRVFSAEKGCSPKQMIGRFRLERAEALLASGVSVSDTARAVGYEDVSYFIRFYRLHVGVSPYQNRTQNRTLTDFSDKFKEK